MSKNNRQKRTFKEINYSGFNLDKMVVFSEKSGIEEKRTTRTN